MIDLDRGLIFLTYIVWALFVFFLAFSFVQAVRTRGLRPALRAQLNARLAVPFVLAIAISIVSASLVFIPPQKTGIVVSYLSPKGIRPEPIPSGLHWIVPLAERVVEYPIFWQTYTMSGKPLEGATRGNDAIVARTSDGQEVALDASVIFRIDPVQVVQLHINWQERYINELLRPVVRGVVRREVSGFTVDEVNSIKRQDLETNLNDALSGTFDERGLILDQFLLRNIAFSEDYAHAVEQKQVAEQGRIKTEYEAVQIANIAGGHADEIRILAEAEAEARLIKARAEAEALRLIGLELQINPDLITYRYVERIAPDVRVIIAPSDANTFLSLPVPPDLAAGEVAGPTFPPTTAPDSSEIVPPTSSERDEQAAGSQNTVSGSTTSSGP